MVMSIQIGRDVVTLYSKEEKGKVLELKMMVLPLPTWQLKYQSNGKEIH